MSINDYNAATQLGSPGPNDRYHARNPPIANVLKEFKRIQTRGNYVGFWDRELIPGKRYTAGVDNDVGLQNHLQGIQRLRHGKYAVVSGGDPHDLDGVGPASHVFVVRIETAPGRGPWGSNIIQQTFPPDGDKIVKVIGIEKRLWHAGGMQVLGDILVVPVEKSDPHKSRIVFLNLADPERPQRFVTGIDRSDKKAAAAALTRLPNQHYVLAVWNAGVLDFYLSKNKNLADGFADDPVSWDHADVKAGRGQDANFSDFQTINFIAQDDDRLFLIGLHNTSSFAPAVPGRDYADLYSVIFPAATLTANPILRVPRITKIAKRHLLCQDRQCNMDGASGTYIDHRGRLHVYSTWHWRSDNVLRISEFASRLDLKDRPITSISEGRIDLFENTAFKGKRLSVMGRRQAHISHYRAINVQGGPFDDRVSSVRFQLPKGYTYTLYEDPDFQGEGLALEGSGSVEEVRNLRSEYGIKRVSSSRFE